MFLRDTLDPASKMHRLPADEHIPGNGRIGCDRRWQKKDKVLIGAVRDAGGIPGRQFTGTTRISDGAFARYSLNPNMI